MGMWANSALLANSLHKVRAHHDTVGAYQTSSGTTPQRRYRWSAFWAAADRVRLAIAAALLVIGWLGEHMSILVSEI